MDKPKKTDHLLLEMRLAIELHPHWKADPNRPAEKPVPEPVKPIEATAAEPEAEPQSKPEPEPKRELAVRSPDALAKPLLIATRIPQRTMSALARRSNDGIALVSEFLADCRNRGLSASSLTRYGYIGKEFFEQFSSLRPSEIKPRDIRAYLAWLHDRGMTEHSINQALSALRSLFRFAEDFEIVPVSPARSVQPRPYKRNLPKPLGEDEINRLIEATTNPRDRALVEFLYATGCRRAEVVNVKVEDVNWDARTVLVTGKGNKQRFVPLNRRAVDSLKAYVGSRSKGWLFQARDCVRKVPDIEVIRGRSGAREWRVRIFGFVEKNGIRSQTTITHPLGRVDRVTPEEAYRKAVELTRRAQTSDKPMNKTSMYLLIRGIARRAGLGHVHTHQLRHTFATHLHDHGADIFTIKELLGHSDISTTSIYTHVSQTSMRKTLEQCHPHWKGTSENENQS